MAYNNYQPTKPDASADNGTNFGANTKRNLQALRDCIAALGGVQGWDMTPSGGTAEEPTTITYAKGTERIKVTLTWTSGNVTKERYEYSSNSGSSYDNMVDENGEAYRNITYDGSGNCSGWTWGTS